MESEKIHLNDVGTSIRVRLQEDGVNVDISTATTTLIFLKKPSGTTTQYTATFVTDGSDGLMHYISVSGDIDEVGTWRGQGFVILPQGEFFTERQSFKVNSNL